MYHAGTLNGNQLREFNIFSDVTGNWKVTELMSNILLNCYLNFAGIVSMIFVPRTVEIILNM